MHTHISKLLVGLALIVSALMGIDNAHAAEATPRTFTLTGYYSPLPNQNFYITGDYASEIRLNGQGIAGADGTPVYPGMIAAPSSYAFGTVICIPDLGCGKVHDRGGAIVKKGERDLAKHDRLDIWMGYGEEGLLRALAFGVKHLDCELYDKSANIAIRMNFEVPPQLGDIVDLPERPIFDTNLSLGSSSDKVKRLQEALNQLGLYEGLINGKFNRTVEKAVFDFQKKYFIVESWDDLGAGNFGPQTRAKMTSLLYDDRVQKQIQEAWDSFHFENTLSTGARNHEVFKLQHILVKNEFMTVNPTGYFGPLTQKALIDFQIAHQIIPHKNASGAGNVGPETQEILNKLLNEEKKHINIEIDRQTAYKNDISKFLRFAGKEDTIHGVGVAFK